ncbi:hypothetical protein PO909_010898 [Leuciscus waleckii]
MTGTFCVDPPLKKAAIITSTGCAPYGGCLWIKSGPVFSLRWGDRDGGWGGVTGTPWQFPVSGGGLAHVKLMSVDTAKPHQASCRSSGPPCPAFLLKFQRDLSKAGRRRETVKMPRDQILSVKSNNSERNTKRL